MFQPLFGLSITQAEYGGVRFNMLRC